MTRWQRLLRRSRLEEQLEKEMGFHLDQHTADLIAQGHDPAEARRLARLALGGEEQVKEDFCGRTSAMPFALCGRGRDSRLSARSRWRWASAPARPSSVW